MNEKKICKKILRIIKKTGNKLLKQAVIVISHKSRNDLLTQNDLFIEKTIISQIKKSFPDINIVSEETKNDIKLKDYTIVIDPIDGTCNFAAGIDMYGIQIALFYENECRFSAIYIPRSKKLFSAYLDGGAYLNGKKLCCIPNKPIDGILLTSDYCDDIEVPLEKQFDLIKELQSKFLKTRLMGAACIDFTMLAENKATAYITYYNKLWDIAPGLLLVKEAGFVCGMLEGDIYLPGKVGLVIASDLQTFEMIIQTYKRI